MHAFNGLIIVSSPVYLLLLCSIQASFGSFQDTLISYFITDSIRTTFKTRPTLEMYYPKVSGRLFPGISIPPVQYAGVKQMGAGQREQVRTCLVDPSSLQATQCWCACAVCPCVCVCYVINSLPSGRSWIRTLESSPFREQDHI